VRTIEPKPLTDVNFEAFGSVMKKPDRPRDIETHWLRYWHDQLDLSNLQGLGTMGFMQMKRVPVVCEKLLVLHNSIEMYLSLDGKPSVCFVAPGKPGHRDPDQREQGRPQPDLEKIEAFYLEGGAGVVVREGIWHWSPFPLTETADFALGLRNTVILRQGDGFTVDEKEILYFDLPEPVTIRL
jgi:ureidoglycolate hydrolase